MSRTTRTTRTTLTALTAVLAMTAVETRGTGESDWLDVLNRARFEECRGAPDLASLTTDPALAAVAQRYAGGGSLQQALSAARYPTDLAAALRIDAVRLDPRAVRQQLRERFCARLTDPALTQAAAVQRGNSVWFIVAAAGGPGSGSSSVPGGANADLPEVQPEAGSADARLPPEGIEYDILARVNEARSRPRRCGSTQYKAAPPLRYSTDLADASQVHAMDMAQRGYFDHATPEGVTPTERLAQTGYRWALTGENIAKGDMGADEAMAGWLQSAGHCANIMDPRFTEMGFGIAADGDRKGALYWVQTFAVPRDDDGPR